MAQIHEYGAFRNRNRVFQDRTAAGKLLAGMLEPNYGQAADAILLSIPMGGVPVAVKIRERLGVEMDAVIVRKIPIPGNTEAGFGAVTSEGDLFLNEPLLARLGMTEDQIERQWVKVREELIERNRRLRDARPLPTLTGKTVILVDDGLASGYTMKAAIYMVNKRKAAKTVLAVPTAPRRTIDALADAVDEIYCANIREVLSFAVADAYKNWYDLDEAEVRGLLEQQRRGDQGLERSLGNKGTVR